MVAKEDMVKFTITMEEEVSSINEVLAHPPF
jgi:hypothetical protein